MIEVDLEEFEDFYKDRLNDQYYKIKKVAKKLIGDIREGLVDIKVCMDHFIESGEDKIEQKAMRSLHFFSDRIKKEIDEIEIPDEVYFDNLNTLVNSIKKMFNNMNEIQRKSLPKFAKEVQSEIKELAYLQRKLAKKQATLDQFLRKKYTSSKYNVKYAEDLLNKIPKLFSLKENIENAKVDLDKFEQEYEEYKQKMDELNTQLLELEKNPLFKELEDLRNQLFRLKIAIKDQLGFKKGLKKLKFALENETILIPNFDEYYLKKFLKRPINTLLEEDKGLTKFSALLVHLRHALEENKLNLKTDKKEKAIEEINEIFEEKKLHDDIDKYEKLKNQIKKTEEKIKEEGLDEQLDEIKNQISVYSIKLEHTENDLNRKNKDYLRYLASLKKEREEFQQLIEGVIEEPVKISITFSF